MDITQLIQHPLLSLVPKFIASLFIFYMLCKVLDFATGGLKVWKDPEKFKSRIMRDGIIRWIGEIAGIIFVIGIDLLVGLNFYLTGFTLALFIIIEDNVSKSAKQNIPWLIAQHNKTSREIDVSIHFNASAGTHSRGIGTETLIYNGRHQDTAIAITDAISNVSGLKNRGVKIRTNLGLLKGTNKPCYLIEVCFVNDSVDVALYKRDFNKICHAIASELAKAVGKTLKPPTTIPSVEDKARNLICKAVADGTFNSPHKEVDNYSTAKLLEYALIYIERKAK